MPSPWLIARKSELYCWVFVPTDPRPTLGQRFLVRALDARDRDQARLTAALEYAREEMCVELASAMMTGLVGLPLSTATVQSHASYIASWLEALRRDKGEIFRAAADAQRICDYLSERALLAVPRLPRSPKQDEKKEVDWLAVERKVRPAAI